MTSPKENEQYDFLLEIEKFKDELKEILPTTALDFIRTNEESLDETNRLIDDYFELFYDVPDEDDVKSTVIDFFNNYLGIDLSRVTHITALNCDDEIEVKVGSPEEIITFKNIDNDFQSTELDDISSDDVDNDIEDLEKSIRIINIEL